MAEIVSVHEPLVEVRQEGDRWNGYITPAWFRYFIASTPDGTGTGTGVLHGNGGGGAPTWGPVVLTSDVSGILPAANGGLGGITGIAGGLLYATGASSYSVTAAGTAHQVLHGGAAPTWGGVDLTADVAGVLPVLNGGTGVTSSTGTGATVRSVSPSLTTPNLTVPAMFGGLWTAPFVATSITWQNTTPLNAPQLELAGSLDFVINTGPTTFIIPDVALFVVIADMTNGGMAIVTMEPLGGLTTVSNTMVSVAFTRLAGTGLQITISGLPFTRRFVGFAAALGA